MKYTVGMAVICLVSFLVEKRNLSQKIFISVTVYLLRWFAAGISLVLWDWCMAFFLNPAPGTTPWQNLFYYIVIRLLTDGIECILFLLEVLFVNRAYLYKKEWMTKKGQDSQNKKCF